MPASKTAGAKAPASASWPDTAEVIGLRVGMDVPAMDAFIADVRVPEQTRIALAGLRAEAARTLSEGDWPLACAKFELLHERCRRYANNLISDGLMKAQSLRSKGKGADPAEVTRFHARLAGEYDATSQTATHFGLSTRQVRYILNPTQSKRHKPG